MCYVYVTGTPHEKLDPRAVRCVFTGYPTSQKGYKCFDPFTKTVDVTFFEKKPYFHDPSHQQEEPESSDQPCLVL